MKCVHPTETVSAGCQICQCLPLIPVHKTDAQRGCLTQSARVDENALRYGKGTYDFLQEPLGFNLLCQRSFTSAPTLSWYEGPGKVPL